MGETGRNCKWPVCAPAWEQFDDRCTVADGADAGLEKLAFCLRTGYVVSRRKEVTMFFLKARKSDPKVKFATLKLKDVDVSNGVVRFKDQEFNLKDVIVASFNRDTVPGDGVGGSALVKTREFAAGLGVVQKTYRATFDEGAMGKIEEISKQIKSAGGTVKDMSLRDDAFRKAFF